jgi:hypothetical protein
LFSDLCILLNIKYNFRDRYEVKQNFFLFYLSFCLYWMLFNREKQYTIFARHDEFEQINFAKKI